MKRKFFFSGLYYVSVARGHTRKTGINYIFAGLHFCHMFPLYLRGEKNASVVHLWNLSS